MRFSNLFKRRQKKSTNNNKNNDDDQVKFTEKFHNSDNDEIVITTQNDDNTNDNGLEIIYHSDTSKQKMNADSKKHNYVKLEEEEEDKILDKEITNCEYERREKEIPMESKPSSQYILDSNNNGTELQFGNFDAFGIMTQQNTSVSNNSPSKKNNSIPKKLKIDSNNEHKPSSSSSDVLTFDQVCFSTTGTAGSEANGTDDIDSVFGSLGQFSDFAYDKFMTVPPSLSSANKKNDKKQHSSNDKNENENPEMNTKISERDDNGNHAEYDKACELLHKHLIRKNHTLTQSERDFLRNLIESDKTNENIAQNIEAASLTLQNDDLFPTPNMSSNKKLIIQSNETQNQKLDKETGAVHNRDNSLDTTKLTMVSESLPNILNQETKSSESMEKKNKYTISSIILDDDSDNETTSTTSSIIRFDGWHDNMDENGYEFGNFQILGTSAFDDSCKPHVLSPPLMEVLQGFLPHSLTESNFWLKYSLIRDGASSFALQSKCRASKYTLIGVETLEGEVFGSFTSSPWQKQKGYFGNGEAFLWRMKKNRRISRHLLKTFSENILEIYPHTGNDDYCQRFLPNQSILCVGGGEWKTKIENPHYKRHDDNNQDNNHGIGLMIDVDRLYGESWPSSTFANPTLCKLSTNAHSFEILNMEVWTFTTCIREEEATNIEMRKFFIENKHSNDQVAL